MASAGVPPDVPPIGLLHAARALRIYRRHEINALAWIALGVCLWVVAVAAKPVQGQRLLPPERLKIPVFSARFSDNVQ